jgi:predicted ATP-dependent serine protease
LAEAARLGFSTAIVPAKSPEVDAKIKLIRVNTVREAMKALGMTGNVPKHTDDF